MEDAAARLAQAGAQLSELKLPADFEALAEARDGINNYERARSMAVEWAAHADQISPKLAEIVRKGQAMGYDDSLDVFGVHGVGGIVGALLTGVFNSPSLGGPGFVADWVTAGMVTAADFSVAAQVWTQAKAVLVTIVWSGVVSLVSFKLVDLTVGLRVTEEEEREGLDISAHGETAYHG